MDRDREVYRHRQEQPPQPQQSPASIADELTKLANLKEKGIISETNETRFDKEENMIGRTLSYYFLVLIIITSFSVVSILHIPRKAMAQSSSEGAKVLVDDAIQALKSNDTSRAQVHLSILNQQLPTFVNSTSLESVNVTS